MIDRWIFSLRYISDIIILCRKFYGGTPLRFTGVPLKFYGGPAGGFQLFRLVFRAAPGRSRRGLAGGLQLLLRGEQVEPAGMALVDLLLQEADADQLPDHLGGAGGRDPQQLPDLLPGEDGVDLPGLVDPLVFPAEVGAVVEQGVQHLCVAGKPAQERLLEQEGEELKILALDGAFGCGALGLGHGWHFLFFSLHPKKGYTKQSHRNSSPFERKLRSVIFGFSIYQSTGLRYRGGVDPGDPEKQKGHRCAIHLWPNNHSTDTVLQRFPLQNAVTVNSTNCPAFVDTVLATNRPE